MEIVIGLNRWLKQAKISLIKKQMLQNLTDRDKVDEEEEEEEPHDTHRPQQKQNKQDMGQTSDINRGGNFQQKANIIQITLQTLTEGSKKVRQSIPVGEKMQ